MTDAARDGRLIRWCRVLVIAGGWSAVPVDVTLARAQDIGYTGSVYVARGTYPTDRVTSVYVFNSVDVTGGPLRVSVSVPFMRQRTTFTGATTDPLTGTPAALEETSTGFGDPLIRVDVRLLDDRPRALQIGIAGSVKPAFVDAASGLGTGAADVAAGGSVFKAAGGTSLFADLLFWKYGDPEDVDFQDTLSYSVGLGRVIGSGRWSAMVSLAGFSHGVDGAAAPLQLNIMVLTLAGRRQSVAVTAGIGLNDSSTDFAIGTSWRIAR